MRLIWLCMQWWAYASISIGVAIMSEGHYLWVRLCVCASIDYLYASVDYLYASIHPLQLSLDCKSLSYKYVVLICAYKHLQSHFILMFAEMTEMCMKCTHACVFVCSCFQQWKFCTVCFLTTYIALTYHLLVLHYYIRII